MGTILGVPIIRITLFWGLYWGPLILGNYHIIPGQGSSSGTRFGSIQNYKRGPYIHPYWQGEPLSHRSQGGDNKNWMAVGTKMYVYGIGWGVPEP